ncbi:TRAP transporter large permease [Thioalkalivibrio sp. HK1]|uniref:TRAP transporter large permease n=1 Tax=Thioalkalivibrio sp. HK1 TaxID=1469245 RepID=UPI00046E8CB4|nr:TRAP transporter large permease subunit [Thioalkalivibrio sp. HK1]
MEFVFLFILLGIMAVALGSGFPVAFALPGAAIITVSLAAICGYLFTGDTSAFFHTGGPYEWLSAGVLNLRGVYWEVERDTLIAIPLFIFMGIMLQRSKIAEDLLVAMAQLFGPVPGGLGISVVFVGALLAATTGIVGATVVAMGLISLPAMLRNRYSPSLATGAIAASGTLGQIIPPSIVLIILADQLASATDQASTARKAMHKEATGELQMPSFLDVSSTSAGEMFLGALIPGLVLVGLYMLYILGYALLKPSSAPVVKREGALDRKFALRILLILIPPLTLIFLVLGSIITGVATVNQAGAIGAVGALVMAGYRIKSGSALVFAPALISLVGIAVIAYALANYTMNIKAASTAEDMTGLILGAIGSSILLTGIGWSAVRTFKIDNTLGNVMMDTAKTTTLVFVILLGAAMLTSAFRAFGGEVLVRDFLTSLPGGFWSQFIIVMLVIFILGFFLDFIEIAVVVVPIVAPILLADPSANITAVWLGVMIGLNIQTSFLTPPFGFALFYLRGVVPKTLSTLSMYRGVVAFITLQLVALAIVGLWPPLVNYLPSRASLLSESAPPPRNPRLQLCLDEYVIDTISVSDKDIREAMVKARALDLATLPDDLARSMEGSIDKAENGLAALGEITIAASAVEAEEEGYRELLGVVRRIEKRIRTLESDGKEIASRIERLPGDAPSQRESLQKRLDETNEEIESLRREIPEQWDGVQKSFRELMKAQTQARNGYRRLADQAYGDVAQTLEILDAGPRFLALEGDLDGIRGIIENDPIEDAVAALRGLEKDFGEIAGGRDIKNALAKARRALDRKQDRQSALEEYGAAIASFTEQKAWRSDVTEATFEGIRGWHDAIRGTLGTRSQERLNREQALFLASCTAHHRDLTLHF